MKPKLDETELMPLFERQELLTENDDEFYKNREILVGKVLHQLKSNLNASCLYWSNKFHLDLSDCESLIHESVLAAVDGYKPSKGKCKFTSFLWTITSQIFKNYLTKIYAQKRTPRLPGEENTKVFAPMVSLQGIVSKDDNNKTEEFQIQDCLESESFEERLQHKQLLKHIYHLATPKEKRVLKRLFFGYTYGETGGKLKMSASEICNIIKRIRMRHNHHASNV